MQDAIRRFLLVASIGLVLVAGYQRLPTFDLPFAPLDPIAAAVDVATREYLEDLAVAADRAAAAPKPTVTATMEELRVAGEAARVKFRDKLTAAMKPQLSPGDPEAKDATDDLDVATAKHVFEQVAKGFRY